MVETDPGVHAIVYRLTAEPLLSRPPRDTNKAILYVSHQSADEELRSERLIRDLIEAEPDAAFYTCDVRGVGDSARHAALHAPATACRSRSPAVGTGYRGPQWARDAAGRGTAGDSPPAVRVEPASYCIVIRCCAPGVYGLCASAYRAAPVRGLYDGLYQFVPP